MAKELSVRRKARELRSKKWRPTMRSAASAAIQAITMTPAKTQAPISEPTPIQPRSRTAAARPQKAMPMVPAIRLPASEARILPWPTTLPISTVRIASPPTPAGRSWAKKRLCR